MMHKQNYSIYDIRAALARDGESPRPPAEWSILRQHRYQLEAGRSCTKP
jgi:hypothetical protein